MGTAIVKYKSTYYGTWIVISSMSGYHTFSTEQKADAFIASELPRKPMGKEEYDSQERRYVERAV